MKTFLSLIDTASNLDRPFGSNDTMVRQKADNSTVRSPANLH